MIVKELVALFGFEVDEKSVDKVDSTVKGVAGKVKFALVAGAATAGALVLKSFVESTAEAGDALLATSERLGVTTRALQELQHVGKLANVSGEELNMGLRSLSRTAFAARSGSQEAAEAFQQVGLSVDAIRGKSPEELFTVLADRVRAVRDPTAKVALAQKLFGRSGAALIPVLNQGSAAIAAQRKELGELGGLMDDELIGLSDEYSDTLVRQQAAFMAVKIAVAKALLPVLLRLQKLLIDTKIAQVIFGNIAQVVASFIEVVLDAVEAVAEWVKGLSPLSKTLLSVAAAVGALAAALFLPFAPIIGLIALILLAIDDFNAWRKGGASAIGSIIVWFNRLLERFPIIRAAISGVSSFFSSAFAFMSSAFSRFWAFLVEKWAQLQPFVSAALAAAKAAWDATWAVLGPTFAAIWEAIKGVVMGFVAFFKSVWDDPKAAFVKLKDDLLATWDALWSGMRPFVEQGIAFVKEQIGNLIAWVKEHPILTAGILLGGAKLFGALAGGGEEPQGFVEKIAAPAASATADGIIGIVSSVVGSILSKVVGFIANNPKLALTGAAFAAATLAPSVLGREPAMGARPGGGSVSQQNAVNVTVNAPGANQDVGAVVGPAVQGALENMLRDGLAATTVGG